MVYVQEKKDRVSFLLTKKIKARKLLPLPSFRELHQPKKVIDVNIYNKPTRGLMQTKSITNSIHISKKIINFLLSIESCVLYGDRVRVDLIGGLIDYAKRVL